MADSDKRRHVRVRRRHPVTLEVRGRSYPAISGDLSPTGLLLHSREIFLPGTAISGHLKLGTRELHFSALIRWSRSAARASDSEALHSMGLSFLDSPGAAYLSYLTRASTATASRLAASAAIPAEPAVEPSKPAAKEVVPPPEPERSSPSRSEGEGREGGPRVHSGHDALVPGLRGRAEGNTRPAGSKLHGPSPFAPSSAAVLFERASVRAIASALPTDIQSLGLSLKVTLSRPPHVTLGTKLEAVATLVEISSDKTLRFQVELREGERLVASGEHQRVLKKI
jgi:predicted thioesterase